MAHGSPSCGKPGNFYAYSEHKALSYSTVLSLLFELALELIHFF
jgi:hypothetical protein